MLPVSAYYLVNCRPASRATFNFIFFVYKHMNKHTHTSMCIHSQLESHYFMQTSLEISSHKYTHISIYIRVFKRLDIICMCIEISVHACMYVYNLPLKWPTHKLIPIQLFFRWRVPLIPVKYATKAIGYKNNDAAKQLTNLRLHVSRCHAHCTYQGA